MISRLLSQETRPVGHGEPSVLRAADDMPPDGDKILALGKQPPRLERGQRTVLHQNVVKIEDQLVGAVLALAQLHVADDKLHAAAVMVFVDLEMERRVHRAARDKAQSAGARSEPDGIKPRPVLGERQAHMAVARKRRDVLDDQILHAEHRLCVLHSVRLEHGKALDILDGQPFLFDHAVDMQLRNELLPGDMGLGIGLEARLQRVDIALVDRKAGSR